MAMFRPIMSGTSFGHSPSHGYVTELTDKRVRFVEHRISLGVYGMCSLCESPDFRVFSAEMNIHFPGRENFEMPRVWAFPPVAICVNCGCAEFAVHGEPLQKLREGSTKSQAS
jgi:hypothetical protein